MHGRMVGLGRLELPTYGLGNRRSIHLSYSPAVDNKKVSFVLSFGQLHTSSLFRVFQAVTVIHRRYTSFSGKDCIDPAISCVEN